MASKSLVLPVVMLLFGMLAVPPAFAQVSVNGQLDVAFYGPPLSVQDTPTAYGDSESRQRAMQAGATDFLTKPLDFDDLKAKISHMIAERKC